MTDDIDIAEQVIAVELAAMSYRAGVDRHEDLAERKRWNGDLLPTERRQAAVLEAAALTFKRMVANGRMAG